MWFVVWSFIRISCLFWVTLAFETICQSWMHIANRYCEFLYDIKRRWRAENIFGAPCGWACINVVHLPCTSIHMCRLPAKVSLSLLITWVFDPIFIFMLLYIIAEAELLLEFRKTRTWKINGRLRNWINANEMCSNKWEGITCTRNGNVQAVWVARLNMISDRYEFRWRIYIGIWAKNQNAFAHRPFAAAGSRCVKKLQHCTFFSLICLVFHLSRRPNDVYIFCLNIAGCTNND